MNSLLIANRGEIALRIIRAAAELGLRTVAIYAAEDAATPAVSLADEARQLSGSGVAAYLQAAEIITIAQETGCEAIHPGYGFLSENADFARQCAAAGITFVGPHPDLLDLFGDKSAARTQARESQLPLLPGTNGPTTLAEAAGFFDQLADHDSLLIKAVAGGGGRGMRVVDRRENLSEAFARCQSEALSAFGREDVYVERYVTAARHIEVQILGDGSGQVSHLGERECTIQRRHQKLIEMAPSPSLTADLRQQLIEASLRLATDVNYDNIGTVEFLVDTAARGFYFLEVNPRLQVEHTVTDEVWGTDLVKLQLQLAMGRSLADLGLSGDSRPHPRGMALQLRVNMEKMTADGRVSPTVGQLNQFNPPTGAGIRVDTFGSPGLTPSPRFDSLLAKLIVFEPSGRYQELIARATMASNEFDIAGVETNLPLLVSVLKHPQFLANQVDTQFFETHLAELITATSDQQPSTPTSPSLRPTATADQMDSPEVAPAGSHAVSAPWSGVVVAIEVDDGAIVTKKQLLLVIEAMKMETVIEAPFNGRVERVNTTIGDVVVEGQPLVFLSEVIGDEVIHVAEQVVDLDDIRPDLAEVEERHERGLDNRRPDAVAKRRRRQQRTARENIADLCDTDSFVEYGSLTIAAQRQRRSVEELIEKTPADGMIAGLGSVNGSLFPAEVARSFIIAYDFTVLAGTQGMQNHRKKDRIFELAEQWQRPAVVFAEGGGGRPGDTEGTGITGLDTLAFYLFAKLSGQVPLVGVTSGRCFAGNALLLGLCDVVIATAGSNIGMGGPAMIEGGGLGVYRPEEIGPLAVQQTNGVVDVAVADEAEAVVVARQYLSYFQGATANWNCADQRLLRHSIPENRLRVYDVHQVIETLADSGSVLELRAAHAPGMVTALARVAGRPIGIVANNSQHLAGAITSDGALKAVRFMKICDAHGIPILFLCDTPGIMVGPEAEETGLVKAAADLFVAGSQLTVPYGTIVLRKCYGLGAMGMAGGTLKAPAFTVAWPTGEFGGMGLEGFVKLGYRRELNAVEDPAERQALYDKLVAQLYEHGKALSVATYFEIDDVIDPAESRDWITRVLLTLPDRRA